MTLNPETREQLLRRADELRTEVSSLTAERDAALAAQSDSIADTKLIAEVTRLQREADAAREDRDRAVVGTEEAIRIMESEVLRQVEAQQVEPAAGAGKLTDAEIEKQVEEATKDSDTEQVAVDQVEASKAEGSTSSRRGRGGNQ